MALAKEQRIQPDIFHRGQVDFRPEKTRCVAGFQLGKGAFGQRHCQTALRAVVRALHQITLDQAQQCGAQCAFGFQIAAGRLTGLGLMRNLQVRRTAQTLQGIFESTGAPRRITASPSSLNHCVVTCRSPPPTRPWPRWAWDQSPRPDSDCRDSRCRRSPVHQRRCSPSHRAPLP